MYEVFCYRKFSKYTDRHHHNDPDHGPGPDLEKMGFHDLDELHHKGQFYFYFQLLYSYKNKSKMTYDK